MRPRRTPPRPEQPLRAAARPAGSHA
jgi:hypothetical protein